MCSATIDILLFLNAAYWSPQNEPGKNEKSKKVETVNYNGGQHRIGPFVKIGDLWSEFLAVSNLHEI